MSGKPDHRKGHRNPSGVLILHDGVSLPADNSMEPAVRDLAPAGGSHSPRTPFSDLGECARWTKRPSTRTINDSGVSSWAIRETGVRRVVRDQARVPLAGAGNHD
jgi:hypothetical protein